VWRSEAVETAQELAPCVVTGLKVGVMKTLTSGNASRRQHLINTGS